MFLSIKTKESMRKSEKTEKRVKIEYEEEKMLEINNRIEKKNTKKMRIGGGECHRLKRLKKDSLLDRSFPSCEALVNNFVYEERAWNSLKTKKFM